MGQLINSPSLLEIAKLFFSRSIWQRDPSQAPIPSPFGKPCFLSDVTWQ